MSKRLPSLKVALAVLLCGSFALSVACESAEDKECKAKFAEVVGPCIPVCEADADGTPSDDCIRACVVDQTGQPIPQC